MARHAAKSPDGAGRRSGGSSQNTNAPGSGVSQEESVTTEAIMAKLARARRIEAGLESLAADSKAKRAAPDSDERSQALRLQLCEVLSDVMLNDPAIAESSDAVGRLWKNCFYGRINDIRNRISREKGRARKRQTAGGGKDAEAAKRMVGDLERQLKQFLREAIQLYRYIVDRYAKELAPLSQTQLSGSSAFSQGQEDERARVIVASLYRMHIHLGDLHRYSGSYRQAEECYLKSARLAPGTGNPYNQLAVVAQQSQEALTAVALYHYARSLMASRAPFETSRSNLVRLFESNRRWLDEHTRDDDNHTRGIVNVRDGEGAGGGDALAVGGRNRKAQREWLQKERTAANRKALARMVDLQWAFFRGVSLDGDDDDEGKTDLGGLMRKMTSAIDAFEDLIGQASFSESLLCKLVAVLAFSSLGASNGGKTIDSEGFYAKRAKDPAWSDEGVIITNQALAFSFLLRFCAVLAMDVETVVAKKDENGNGKLGSIRSLSPMLLGFRFAVSVYDGCQWFHGLPFYPSTDDAAKNSDLESNSIYKLCRESHEGFWRSMASVANRLDKLPSRKNKCYTAEEEGLEDINDFVEYRGYVPFTSFLEPGEDTQQPNDNKTKYASAIEAIDALAEGKQSGGSGKGGAEAETNLKISVFIAVVDKKTSPDSIEEGVEKGQAFLARSAVSDEREYLNGKASTEDCEDEGTEGEEEQSLASVRSQNITDDEDLGVADITPPDAGGKDADMVPLKMSYSDKGMALLTPAALLASGMNADDGRDDMETMKPATGAFHADSIMAPVDNGEQRPKLLGAAGISSDSLLKPAFLSTHQKESSPEAAVPRPPPGFSARPPLAGASRLPHAPATAPTGISLTEFAAPTGQPADVLFGSAFTATGGGVMPQAGPSRPAPGLFETMNPFFSQAPPPSSLSSSFVGVNPSSTLNPPPGLLPNVGQGGPILQQPAPIKGRLDPTLDFLLSNNQLQSPNPNALDHLIPSQAVVVEPEDQTQSILNFLFNSGDHTSQAGVQPVYGDGQYPHQGQHHGVPPTKNPFAT